MEDVNREEIKTSDTELELGEEVVTGSEAETVTEPRTEPEKLAAENDIQIPPPKKKTAQERIDELTKKRREAEREADKLRKQLEDAGKQVPKTASLERPKIEDFLTQEEYEDSLFEWRDQQRSKKEELERSKAEIELAYQKFQEKARPVREIYHDFDDVVESPVFSETMKETILKSDDGPMVAYYLGRPENRALAERISLLPDKIQIYEIGKLEAKLAIAQKTKKVTSAPDPIKTSGISGGAVPVDESKLNDDEWYAVEKKRRLEQLQKKFGG